MTKRTPTTTRRDVLAGVGIFAGIAVAAPAVASIADATAEDAKWREFIRAMASAHPNGRAAAENARACGMNLAELSRVTLHDEMSPPEDLPLLWFGDLQKCEHYFNVSPRWFGEYKATPRGAGPDLTDELREMGLLGKAVRS